MVVWDQCLWLLRVTLAHELIPLERIYKNLFIYVATNQKNHDYPLTLTTTNTLVILHCFLILESKVSQTLSFKSCGENVKLSNDRRCAAWNFIESDGVTFSNRPMDHLEHVTLDVTGSGEVAIGAIESDPVVQSRRLSSFSTCPDLKTAVIVKTYDSSYQVKISRDSDLLIVFCDDQRYVMEVDQKKKPWLVFNLRFGDLQIELGKYQNLG